MNHSRHFHRTLLILTIAPLLVLGPPGRVTTAEATILYTFTTTVPAPLAGPVSGTFSVSDSAILDGFIAVQEISSYRFVLASAAPPFTPVIFSAPDPLTTVSPFGGAIAVDPNTGTFTMDAVISVNDPATSQRLGINARSLVGPRYEVDLGQPPFFQESVSGDGIWTVQRVPGPRSLLLLVVALVCLMLRGVRPLALLANLRGLRQDEA